MTRSERGEREDRGANTVAYGLDRDEIFRLSSRPPWSIRSRRRALGPFLEMIREMFSKKA